jgi:RNA polymerase sigma-70 factor (ECF subfamily)
VFVDEEEAFRQLINRVRAGDPDAATQLVREYEPEIRRAVRVRLTDPALRRVLDSLDICQSVLGNFFARAAAGQFDLDRPQQLLKLLVTMARNRLRDQVRKQRARRRDNRRLEGGARALEAVHAMGATPSHIVAGRELLEEVRTRLADEERYLADQRALGREWAELAAELGERPDALRKRLARALDRILKELGLDGAGAA